MVGGGWVRWCGGGQCCFVKCTRSKQQRQVSEVVRIINHGGNLSPPATTRGSGPRSVYMGQPPKVCACGPGVSGWVGAGGRVPWALAAPTPSKRSCACPRYLKDRSSKKKIRTRASDRSIDRAPARRRSSTRGVAAAPAAHSTRLGRVRVLKGYITMHCMKGRSKTSKCTHTKKQAIHAQSGFAPRSFF